MLLQVVEQRVRILLSKAQIRVPDELRPPKAVRAVGVARLGLPAAKNSTVSAYLCCTPVSSAFFGALSVFWPAGWGFRASRITSTVALMALGSPASRRYCSASPGAPA